MTKWLKILVAFYVNDELIASWDPVWLQESFDIFIRLFERIGLLQICLRQKSWYASRDRYARPTQKEQYAKYKSLTVAAANNKHRRVDCKICSANLAAGSYQRHLESQHKMF